MTVLILILLWPSLLFVVCSFCASAYPTEYVSLGLRSVSELVSSTVYNCIHPCIHTAGVSQHVFQHPRVSVGVPCFPPGALISSPLVIILCSSDYSCCHGSTLRYQHLWDDGIFINVIYKARGNSITSGINIHLESGINGSEFDGQRSVWPHETRFTQCHV